MLTRSLYLAGGWFAISLITMLLVGPRLRKGHFLISLGWLLSVLLLGDLWAILTFGTPVDIALLTGLAFLLGIFFIIWLRDWNAVGQVTWTMTILATMLFIFYAFMVTAFTPLNAVSFLIALAFFFIEAIALFMALTHTYESLEVMCRIRWRRRIDRLKPIAGYAPMVSLHVPTYNEPPEVVEATLHSLAQLDYPNYEVLVVDNNTPDEDNWRKLNQLCQELGPKFYFMHLDKWPGYKSGALNFALSQTAPEAEIIGSIDADYRLDPSFLRELIPAFANPSVAFVQTPQDYRDFQGDPYSESTYHGYKYFFEVSMPARNEHNAIIYAGTMGLIRKSVLQEIGGWDEWCITEDAEASLRILKRGYESLYIKRSYGWGLMPFTFDGLKKQRFRWCFGGIQILRKHWESLMPWAGWIEPDNHLTIAQRYLYLVGGLQWFTDVFNLLFAFFLILGGISSVLSGRITIRPLTGPLLVMPAIFLLLNLWRFVWVLRHTLHLSWRVAMRSMYNFFSLGWAVTLACIQGLIQKRGVFLRTPKSKSKSKMLRALQVTSWETLIGLVCVLTGIAAVVAHPEIKTIFLCILLFWEASLYLSAPYYSLLSIRATPERRVRRQIASVGVPVLENRAAQLAIGMAIVLVFVASAAQFFPPPKANPSYARYQPADVPPERLLGLEKVPIDARDLTPNPALKPKTTQAGIPRVSVTPVILSVVPAATSTPIPTSLPGNPTPTPVPPTPAPTGTEIPASPTSTPVGTYTPTPQQSAGPSPTLASTPISTFIPLLTVTPSPLPLNLTATPVPLGTLPSTPGLPLSGIALPTPETVTSTPVP